MNFREMLERPMYFDRKGRPITMEQWATRPRWYKRIDSTDVFDCWVSTVWLGLDHGWGLADEPPIIFETQVFGGPMDGEMLRYCTEEEARRGHRLMVAEVQRGIPYWRWVWHAFRHEVTVGSRSVFWQRDGLDEMRRHMARKYAA